MSKRNSIERSKYINHEYKEYLKSSFKFSSPKLQKLFENRLEKEELFKGPYVDLNLPFERGMNLNKMISEGVICKSFQKLESIDFERPLYAHQEESIRHICSGHSAIITTGTGSGKTECFLFPILNELLSDIENGNVEVGIRAMFLYPMNALVNDQIDRVRKMLSKCPEITYGFFTGETPEKVSKNYREKYKEENDIVIPENELISREEIRNNPPHLLFTNYSMLEYLLIRPNDYSLFTPNHINNWKFVVLDEAHSYSGSLGIELSLLLRRVTGLAIQKPRFILTSATLGKQGKSEDDILKFARNLTSAEFYIDDIIFSKRVLLCKSNIQYVIHGEDYSKIVQAKGNMNLITDIGEKYKLIDHVNLQRYLYELLICDKNVYRLYELLKDRSYSFDTILKSFHDTLTASQLVDMIDLINMANKDGIGIFDLKYHSFVRPLAGAYITLGNNPQLSLTKTNMIGNLKAFETGNCKFCNSPYIIGKIVHDSTSGIDYLYQNKEIDIYENYGNNESINLDYFLMDNDINDEEVDYDILEEYEICAKCGSIHVATNLNAHKCKCDESFKYPIYKVLQSKKDDEIVARNNINQCPCCGHKSKSGVVKSLNVGKDEGTALIAQMLYEAIDKQSESENKPRKLSLKKNSIDLMDIEKPYVKQFLAFSDSRQQAGFAAVFFNSNHIRILRKRLIWKVIEDNNFQEITVDELTANLEAIIKEKDLFQNDLSPHKNAWAAMLVDLLKVDGSFDGEGLGLYYFDLNLKEIMSQIDEDDVEEAFGKYNIDKKDLETIMQVVFTVFKITPAISYIKSTLTPEEKMNALGYRRFDNYVMLQTSKSKVGVRSLLPVHGKDNMVVRYIQKVCNCDEESAKSFLEIIFNNLAVEGGLLKKHDREACYQIEASKYIVKNYKNNKYYKCSKCGRLTPYNVHNKCIQDNCNGTLQEVDPDEELSSNYYRKQYKNKTIEKIVIKEHTAQLDRKTAKKYQQDFKNKKINILSCSTTFEMGIDIGDLEVVFLRNVPPTPANYVQRAGRAGRRKDSAAYILTYCDTGSHDYTYFCNPEKMISGIINPPYFNVVNHKIIVRHLMATCLGFFFRNYPEYFKSIDGFVFEDGLQKFKEYVFSHPKDLKTYIDKKILPENVYREYHNFKWFEDISGNDEKLEHFVNTVRFIAEEYQKAMDEAIKDESYKEADYYQKQIKRLHNEKIIDALSKYCVIPKYGFPVDVVELQVYSNGIVNNHYDLNRDLKIAISEYAPDSEVIVDGKKFTSKYITLPKTGEFQKNYFCSCPNCKKINVSISTRITNRCKYCGEKLNTAEQEFYIEPVNGFKTGITKESTRAKPKRSYSGEVSYIGGGIKDEEVITLSNSIIIETSSNDELLVINTSPFHMCPICGYSDKDKGKLTRPILEKPHKNFRQFDCENTELKRIKLGHKFQTDVARFTIPSLSSTSKKGYTIALSFLYAFLEGVSIGLGIERNDIDGIIEQNVNQHSYDILIYDNVPGGAGHVKRLINKKAVIVALNAAHDKVSQNCCDENTSCYNCLRNYYNQSVHSKLKRKYARDFIEELLIELGETS